MSNPTYAADGYAVAAAVRVGCRGRDLEGFPTAYGYELAKKMVVGFTPRGVKGGSTGLSVDAKVGVGVGAMVGVGLLGVLGAWCLWRSRRANERDAEVPGNYLPEMISKQHSGGRTMGGVEMWGKERRT